MPARLALVAGIAGRILASFGYVEFVGYLADAAILEQLTGFLRHHQPTLVLLGRDVIRPGTAVSRAANQHGTPFATSFLRGERDAIAL
ncbi:MAG TPA: hypothetical protein VMP01_18525 [Pirellulaceae bacterium]|nr:hypothetical protein [Pirellulaceae bacterium]